jgi:pyruvate dehydrogenase E2 component (dihydrolipoamide acetyltransferase)
VQVGQTLVVIADKGKGVASASDKEGVASASDKEGVASASDKEVENKRKAVSETVDRHGATHTQGRPLEPKQAPERGKKATRERGGVKAPGRPVPAAPATRRLAREHGVDINLVSGSGPAGRVTPEDVLRFSRGNQPKPTANGDAAVAADDGGEKIAARAGNQAQSAGGSAAAVGLPFVKLEPFPAFERYGAVQRRPLRSIRRKVAQKMATARVVVPQVTHTDEVDVTALEALRRQLNDTRPEGEPHLTATAFLVKAVIAGLKAQPHFNASLDPQKQELVLKQYFNIGVAADSPKGLLVFVIKEADRKSLVEVAAAVRDLSNRARADELTVEDFQGGSFTISNIGALGGFSPNPIVNYPEVALLGVGMANARPVVHGDRVVVRTIMPLALSFDHRVADGGDAARFMNKVKYLLENPQRLLVSA